MAHQRRGRSISFTMNSVILLMLSPASIPSMHIFTLVCIFLLSVSSQAARQVLVPGEILLGGLFPVHAAGLNGTHCGKLKADQGMQRLIAMLFTLEEINRDGKILPQATLGAQILDTCSVDSYALEQTLEFVRGALGGVDIACREAVSAAGVQVTAKQPVAAVIGAASSQVSVMVSSMLQLFNVALVSYSSTGSELSEKTRFPLFSRVVPPDNLQATVMANLIKKLDWNYVHAVADSGSYGEKGMESFRYAASNLGVCIDGEVHKIGRRPTETTFREVIMKMHRTKKARGVVMFVDEDNLKFLLNTLEMMIREGNKELVNYFWFVASDSWGKKQSVVNGRETRLKGAITISPKLRTVSGFDEYFTGLRPSNTFLEEYWVSLGCDSLVVSSFGECFETKNIFFKQESYVPYVVDAVKAVATAISAYIRDKCGHIPFSSCNISSSTFNGAQLQKYYRNVTIGDVRIDANGDGIGRYDVYQLNSVGEYISVGYWDSEKPFYLKVERIRRNLVNSNHFPFSVCSHECPKGYYRSYQDQTCCWACIPCDANTSIVVNVTLCEQCPLGQVPGANLLSCVPIPAVSLEWDTLWAITPAAFSVLGIAATAFVLAVFLKYNATPVIMASGRELCYCMLTGITLCYVLTFFLVSKPSTVSCGMSRVLIGLCMSAIYAAIITKTNRLARVFSPHSAQRPRFITPRAQVGICLVIVSVQLLGSLVWLVMEPPRTTVNFPSRTEAVLSCNQTTASHLLVSLSYNMILIIACTVYAFKTRKIPENFNETRLIGFTMYSTSILWLAFVPIYFATQNNFRIQLTSLCMCVSLSGTVALICFFGPKVYIVLFQPYKNVRTRQSAVGRLVNQQMRFISQLTTHEVAPSEEVPRAPSLNTPRSGENLAAVAPKVTNNGTKQNWSMAKMLSWNERGPKVSSFRRFRQSLKLRSKSVREPKNRPVLASAQQQMLPTGYPSKPGSRKKRGRASSLSDQRIHSSRPAHFCDSGPSAFPADSRPLLAQRNSSESKKKSSLDPISLEHSSTSAEPSQIELILDEIISGNPKSTFL